MKKIGIHLAIMLVIALALILVFFYNFLPSYTNHGETITVPDLKGSSHEQLDQYLASRTETGKDEFSLAADVHLKYSKLADELYIGGVYVSRFLKEPTYNLRDSRAWCPSMRNPLRPRKNRAYRSHRLKKL